MISLKHTLNNSFFFFIAHVSTAICSKDFPEIPFPNSDPVSGTQFLVGKFFRHRFADFFTPQMDPNGGLALLSGKFRLVKYDNLARYIHRTGQIFMHQHLLAFFCGCHRWCPSFALRDGQADELVWVDPQFIQWSW